jgi:hypothetical protein
MVIVSRVFISQDFFMYPMLNHRHMLQAVQLPPENNGDLINADVLVDPIPVFLRLSRVKRQCQPAPPSSFIQKRK